jgi:hypothetical protein
MHHSFSQHLKRTLLTCLLLLAVVVSALSLTQPVDASYYTYLDRFGTAAYNNSDGSASWTANSWTETNDDNSATGGNVRITGGELRVCSTCSTNDGDFEAVQRTVNLSTAAANAQILLSYSFSATNLDAGQDYLTVDVYNGSAWTTLETVSSGNASGIRDWDITAYKNAATAIRFRITGGFTSTNEIAYFDDVQITYATANTHTSVSVLPYVQTYYLPLPEDQVLYVLDAINTAAVSPTYSYISITIVANNTVIYYDQWEDTYETAINDPSQSSTEVWGDNNLANGLPPGYTTDVLHAGDIIILQNPVNIGTLGSVYTFDGRDKLASTDAVAVTRTSWASDSGTLHAGSEEVLDTSIWGTTYDIPVATSLNAYDFTYMGLSVMAAQDNTRVYNNAGSLVATLNEGQSYLFDNNIALGDRITTSLPVQATLLTGHATSNYESDFFTLYPNDLLSNSYYAVVPSFATSSDGSATNTAIYLYNPGASSITVHWRTTAGLQSNITVPSRGGYRQVMPTTATAARFYTDSSSDVFSAISIIDSGNQRYDWGYTLVPQDELTQQAKVGWGPGRDPTSTTNPTENASPVWFTVTNTNGSAGNISVCVDYNGDDAGAYADTNGYHYDALYTVAPLSQNKIYDSDGDQTGMLL